MKYCRGCDEMHPIGMFNLNNSKPDGRQTMCRARMLEQRRHRREFPSRYPSAPVAKLLRYHLRTERVSISEFARRYAQRYGVEQDTAYRMLSRILNDPVPELNEETVDRIACLCGIPSIFLLEPDCLPEGTR